MKALPLAAIAAASVKIDEHSAEAYEVKPKKKYVVVAPSRMSADAARTFGKHIHDMGIEAVVVFKGEDLTIYELD
jgi:hypothetical protein